MDTAAEDEPKATLASRRLDATALKALAHPLRMQIFEELVQFGPLTATGLGERLGESSGAMSYHLRELAKHGFVREVEGKGTARERWWERTPQLVTMQATELDGEAANTAANLVAKTWHQRWFDQTMDFLDRGDDVFDPRWIDASRLMHTALPLTIEQFEALGAEIDEVFRRAVERYRGQEAEGVRRVQLQFNTYPLIDPKEINS